MGKKKMGNLQIPQQCYFNKPANNNLHTSPNQSKPSQLTHYSRDSHNAINHNQPPLPLPFALHKSRDGQSADLHEPSIFKDRKHHTSTSKQPFSQILSSLSALTSGFAFAMAS